MSERKGVRVLWRGAAVLALLIAAGCSVDQKQEVATYRRELDGDRPVQVPPLGATEPLTLDRALRLANVNNEQLGLQGETYLQALIDKTRAVAAFLPTVDLSASYAVQSSDTARGARTSHAARVSTNASISLFDLRNWSNLQVAEFAVEERRQLLLDLQATVMLQVAQSFYDVLRFESQVQVLKESLSLQSERVRDMQAREKLGISKPLDLAQAQADESNTRVLLLQADSNARNARSALAFLIGVPTVQGELQDQFQPPPPGASASEYEAEAERYRQDLLAAAAAVEAARNSVESAVRQYFPTVTLGAGAPLWSDPSGGLLWSLSFSALMPVFSAGLIHADIRTAWSRYRQTVLDQSMLRRQIHEQIEIAYENLQASAAKIRELGYTVAAAQRAYDLSVASYRLGAASNLDQLTAQDSLRNAQLLLSNEQYNEKVFFLELRRATGQFGPDAAEQLPTTPPPPPGPAPNT